MKALSVRMPWWWWILYGGKDIENRDWPTSYRGTIYLHAGKWFQAEEAWDDWGDALSMFERSEARSRIVLPTVSLRDMQKLGGHVVGRVDIVDCVTRSDSPWFVGKFGLVLRNATPLETPFPVKGALGLFEIPGASASDVSLFSEVHHA